MLLWESSGFKSFHVLYFSVFFFKYNSICSAGVHVSEVCIQWFFAQDSSDPYLNFVDNAWYPQVSFGRQAKERTSGKDGAAEDLFSQSLIQLPDLSAPAFVSLWLCQLSGSLSKICLFFFFFPDPVQSNVLELCLECKLFVWQRTFLNFFPPKCELNWSSSPAFF